MTSKEYGLIAKAIRRVNQLDDPSPRNIIEEFVYVLAYNDPQNFNAETSRNLCK